MKVVLGWRNLSVRLALYLSLNPNLSLKPNPQVQILPHTSTRRWDEPSANGSPYPAQPSARGGWHPASSAK